MNNLAIATPVLNAYSETFIRAHIERLPAKVIVLHGGTPPTLVGIDSPVIPPFTLGRHLRWSIEHRVRGLTWEDMTTAYLAKALRNLQLDAVLAEYGPMGVSLMEACSRAEVPLVVHFHGYDAYKQEVVAKYQEDYRRLFNQCAALVANTNSMQHRLVCLGASENIIHRNPIGVDIEQFSPTAPDANPPVLLAVGRFVDKKAPYLTLLAFHRALHAAPDLRLIMVGSGPLWEVCTRLAETLGVGEKVRFPGMRTSTEVAMLMRDARGFVQHSLTALDGDSESLGVVFLEAGASGLPVIATRHDGIPEVVVDGETGLLVDEGDVDGMTEAMIRLARDPQLALKMGQAGRKRIEEHFSMEQSIGSLWRIIESAMDGGPGGRAPR